MAMATRPNILLIITHDLGTRLGCYGETSVTPDLDAFAAEGVRFANHFCTSPKCSPSRGSIFTGKYPHTNGLMGLVNVGWDLPENNTTLAHILGSAGYETFLFGLQHEAKDPKRLGFHHLSVGKRRCDDVAPMVVDFLETRGGAKPFYARVGFSEVHRPYERYEPEDPESVKLPAYIQDTPGARQDFAMFDGCIRRMDKAVGRILEALDHSGLSDDTVVIFTTDHGIAFPRAKDTLYDPGIHTTLIMRWPNGMTGGRTMDELISSIDLLPSLLEMADAPVPASLQGRSFWGLLSNGDCIPEDRIFAEHGSAFDDIKRCIRTGKYKYIRNYDVGPMLRLPSDIELSLTRRDMDNTHLAPRPPVELYDLMADPLEMSNLAGAQEVREIEAELAARLNQFLEETDDPVLRGPIPRPPAEAEIGDRIRRGVDDELRKRGWDNCIPHWASEIDYNG